MLIHRGLKFAGIGLCSGSAALAASLIAWPNLASGLVATWMLITGTIMILASLPDTERERIQHRCRPSHTIVAGGQAYCADTTCPNYQGPAR